MDCLLSPAPYSGLDGRRRGETRVPARAPANEAASGAHSRMPQWPGKPEGPYPPPRMRVYGSPTEVEIPTEVEPS